MSKIKLVSIDANLSRIFYKHQSSLYFFQEGYPGEFDLYRTDEQMSAPRALTIIDAFIDVLPEPIIPRNPKGAALMSRFDSYIQSHRNARRSFKVTWQVDIEPDQATDPRTAAMIAQRMQQVNRTGYDMGVFNLTDQFGTEYKIDLNKKEENLEIN